MLLFVLSHGSPKLHVALFRFGTGVAADHRLTGWPETDSSHWSACSRGPGGGVQPVFYFFVVLFWAGDRLTRGRTTIVLCASGYGSASQFSGADIE